MEHRIRTAKSCDGQATDHTFVEIEPDSWLEVGCSPADLTFDGVDAIREYQRNKRHHLTFATRAFETGIVKDWKEAGIVNA